jgi:multidrug resistance efflux pump
VITCMCLIYTAFIVLLFKLKILEPRPYPIAWSAVGGILVIGAIVVFWHLDAPMSSRVVTTQYVVQLVPYIKGQIKKVVAKANHPVKKGDVLVEIDPAPYQFAVNQLEAQLQSAKDNVQQATAGVEAADANVRKSEAGVAQATAAVDTAKANVTGAEAAAKKAGAADELAKVEEQMDLSILQENAVAISRLKVDQATQNRKEADAAYEQAQTGIIQAQAAAAQAQAELAESQASRLQAVAAAAQAKAALQTAQSNVPDVQAQLDDAHFNLAQCTMYAPEDGYIVDWQVQEGSWVSPIRLLAIGTFIVAREEFVVAVFPQNFLMNVRSGDEVEVILDPYPGRLFKAKVDSVITATGEGQFAPSKTIPEASQIGSHGLLAVKISLIDDDRPADLPLGAGGTVAIYTDRGKPVHIISKVTLRMKKWLLYVLPS